MLMREIMRIVESVSLPQYRDDLFPESHQGWCISSEREAVAQIKQSDDKRTRKTVQEAIETVDIYGTFVSVYRNPSVAQLLTASHDNKLRGLIDHITGDTFWWPASQAIHVDVARELGLSGRLYSNNGNSTMQINGNIIDVLSGNVRGREVPVIEDPTRQQAFGFLKRYGRLRASAIWDGTLLIWPASMAVHGDIYDGDDQWTVKVEDQNHVSYRIDSSLENPAEIEALAKTVRFELPRHVGLLRALGAFEVIVDSPYL